MGSVVGRGGSTVNLDNTANQIQQPSVSKQKRMTDEEPLIVAKWEVEEFVWFSRFLDDLPVVYEKLLGRLGVDPDGCACDVDGFYAYRHDWDENRKCDVECIYVPRVRAGRYHPYSSVKHRRRASSRTLDRLEFLEEECRRRRVKFDYVITIDLTLPKQVSRRWDDRDVQSQIREAIKDFLSELQEELFPKHSSQFGAISNHHYWASKSPLSPHCHVHLTLPNVVYNKRAGMFHRFQPMVKADLVRRVWKRALVDNGLWLGVPDDAEPDVYAKYIKFEERGRVIHRLSYCCRKPIEDLVRNLTDSDLDDFDRDFALFLLDYTPRVVNLGFLTDLKRFGYSHKPSVLKCPICGGDMYPEVDDYGHPVLYDRPPPELMCLFRSRAGEWVCAPSGD